MDYYKKLYEELEYKFNDFKIEKEEEIYKLKEIIISLKKEIVKDSLLPVYNRRYFFEKAKEILENPRNECAIIMIDLDNFKSINDTFGHQFGDKVLIETAKVINESISKGDILARYGGEELIILIKDYKDLDELLDKVEKIRIEIKNNKVKSEIGTTQITASFGIALYPYDGKNITELIFAADKLLYLAKSNGKDMTLINEFKK